MTTRPTAPTRADIAAGVKAGRTARAQAVNALLRALFARKPAAAAPRAPAAPVRAAVAR